VIVGTMAAWEASSIVKEIASRIANLLQYELSEGQLDSQERIAARVNELRIACDGFVEVARKELN
jgi:hypothetical protein